MREIPAVRGRSRRRQCAKTGRCKGNYTVRLGSEGWYEVCDRRPSLPRADQSHAPRLAHNRVAAVTGTVAEDTGLGAPRNQAQKIFPLTIVAGIRLPLAKALSKRDRHHRPGQSPAVTLEHTGLRRTVRGR